MYLTNKRLTFLTKVFVFNSGQECGLLTFVCMFSFLAQSGRPMHLQTTCRDGWNRAELFFTLPLPKTNFLQFPANHSFSSIPECNSISCWGSLTPVLCLFSVSPVILLRDFAFLLSLALKISFWYCNSLSQHLPCSVFCYALCVYCFYFCSFLLPSLASVANPLLPDPSKSLIYSLPCSSTSLPFIF